jgi:hypothetical protein
MWGTVAVVVRDAVAEGAEKLAFVQHDQVIEELASEGADKTLRVAVLPGGDLSAIFS